MRFLLPLLAVAALCACEGTDATVTVSSDGTAAATPAESEPVPDDATDTATDPGFYALSTRTLEGDPVDLSRYVGQVSVVVNVASKCGYTPQYTGLQELHEQLGPMGVNVLAFPSNDFGGQEPGSPEEIRAFCSDTYGVTFPVFEKVQTKAGSGQSPIYAFLGEQTGELPGWNFCKYVIDKSGQPIAFFESGVEPGSAELRAAIDEAL